MSKLFYVQNTNRSLSEPIYLTWADRFLPRLRGLMFAKPMPPNVGLALVYDRDDRTNSAIHMFFMRFDIAAVWINSAFRVVDVQHAKPWRPMYRPARAARYVLELHPSHLNDFKVGDVVRLSDKLPKAEGPKPVKKPAVKQKKSK